jgi:hypothetical protein
MFGVALAITVAAGAWWEQRVRAMGYAPTYNDTPNLWADRRALARDAGPEQIVFVGSSRVLFDADLEVFAQATGGPLPIQLATVGSNPLPILMNLAEDPTYAGTTIVGVVPGLVAAAAGPPLATPTRFAQHYEGWSPADRLELPMSLWLQDRLAFINQDDLPLTKLVDRALDLPPRKDAYAPELPGYMYTLDRTRRGRMTDKIANNPAEAHKIQQTWLPLFNGPPRPAVFTEEQWAKMMDDGWEANLTKFKAAVQSITTRGGKVIFVRFPSTDVIRALENERLPRSKIWDRLIEETGAPGIHFEDYPELRGFDCPEWSHLSAPDSVEFSKRLVQILQAQGLLR